MCCCHSLYSLGMVHKLPEQVADSVFETICWAESYYLDYLRLLVANRFVEKSSWVVVDTAVVLFVLLLWYLYY